MAIARSRPLRKSPSFHLALLVLGTSLLSFAWGREASSPADRDHRHAHLTIGTAATIRGEFDRLEERAREGPDAGKRDVVWLGTHIGAGIPPSALARRILLHGADSAAASPVTIEPRGRDGRLGLRSGLAAPDAFSGRLPLIAFASLALGFFGLLFGRRRVGQVPESPSERLAPHADSAAFRSIPYPVLIHRDGRIVWSNPAAARGLRPEAPFALPGTRLDDWLDTGQEPRWREHLRQLDAGERVATSEIVFRAEDGRAWAAEVRSVRVSFGGQPSVESVIGLAPGTRARRAAATDAASPPPGLARRTLDALDDGVLVLDGSGAIGEANARAEGLLGYSAAVLRRMDVASLCSSATKEELTRLRAALARANRGERGETIELEVRTRDGRALVCELAARPMDAPGRIVLVVRTTRAGAAADPTETPRP